MPVQVGGALVFEPGNAGPGAIASLIANGPYDLSNDAVCLVWSRFKSLPIRTLWTWTSSLSGWQTNIGTSGPAAPLVPGQLTVSQNDAGFVEHVLYTATFDPTKHACWGLWHDGTTLHYLVGPTVGGMAIVASSAGIPLGDLQAMGYFNVQVDQIGQGWGFDQSWLGSVAPAPGAVAGIGYHDPMLDTILGCVRRTYTY
jgi:hypothetical protein